MSDKSKIEWTDSTWNPIRARNIKTGKVGWYCEHATTGCEHCYAERQNKRLGTGLPFKPSHRKDVDLFLDETMLTQPLRWKKPRMIFPNSMTDLFADFMLDEWIDRVFAVMALTPQHTYQVLTKRAGRMREYLTRSMGRRSKICDANRHADLCCAAVALADEESMAEYAIAQFGDGRVNNVWLGVSAERQQEADERIPLLLQTPAAVRFISAEPLLGPIDLTRISFGEGDPRHKRQALSGQAYLHSEGINGHPDMTVLTQFEKPMARLDWVIVGGESGPKARSAHPAWVRSLRDQCQVAGTAFFLKQWGEWAPSTPDQAKGNPRSGWQAIKAHPHAARAEELYPEAGAAFVARVGKARAGRLLDGVEHNGMPKVRR